MTSIATVKSSEIVPRFFGAGERQLFGIYHAPDGATIRDAGVVLCYPGPQEYSQVHWGYQKLAGLLAAAGFHVLRFDYYGTGDSYGDTAAGSLAQWSEDVGRAVTELRDIAGIRRVSAVAMRLGGAIALRASASGVKLRDLVLWDPVVSGTEYVSLLDATEDLRLRMLNYPEPNDRVPGEVLGYAFTDAMRAETQSVDLRTEPVGRIDRILLIGAAFTAAQESLVGHFEAAGARVSMERVDDPALYAPGRHPSDSLLSHNIPVAITNFLARSGT